MNKLKEILETKRVEVAAKKTKAPLLALVEQLESLPPTRGFMDAIRSREVDELACIAEIKKASPSKGVIAKNFRPEKIAREYQVGGAKALSVLTDEKYFLGSDSYVGAVKQHVVLPVLRKDFIVDEYQVYESRVIGADAILLIVAALKESELVKFMSIARDLDLECLVECHTKNEIDRAVQCGALMIGINNRDLQTFEVNVETSLMLKRFIPNSTVAVSESGIRNPHHLDQLRQAGFDAILVGEHLMSQQNRTKALRDLFQVPAAG
ncbi:MAG TPA: indole-3-glycerol phosphate synthase TrpC [Bacteroidota bacterium]|nr:indole-3-glycerol phosphate synthase TrpC [Bacteroidota bacterium]